MSRIGNSPINIPDGINVNVDNKNIKVSGSKGSHSFVIHDNIKVVNEGNTLVINRVDDSAVSRSMHGTTRQIIHNMIVGISEGFRKDLEIVGVGYQASIQGSRLKLQLGFSHVEDLG